MYVHVGLEAVQSPVVVVDTDKMGEMRVEMRSAGGDLVEIRAAHAELPEEGEEGEGEERREEDEYAALIEEDEYNFFDFWLVGGCAGGRLVDGWIVPRLKGGALVDSSWRGRGGQGTKGGVGWTGT